jgi:uncharacterized repeat protein (TIGR03803 family)
MQSGRIVGSFVVLAFLAPHAILHAQYLENVLYSFCTAGGTCVDGSGPASAVIADSEGNLYGTTVSGGAYGQGTVFELSPPSSPGAAWTEKVLYSFCSQTNCSDGATPSGPVVLDSHGNLYGTTRLGGNTLAAGQGCGGVSGGQTCGVVFELSPSAGGSWQYSLLYAFSGYDGAIPSGGVIFDPEQQNLYGVTEIAGGLVFELSPTTGGTTPWTETVIYRFGVGPNQPVAGLVIDSQGNLYGTTMYDNGSPFSAVFEITQSGGQWVENTLYIGSYTGGLTDFLGVVTFDAQHNIYTTAAENGSGLDGGGVMELTPPTNGGLWNENTIYAFNQNNNGATGSYPAGGVIFDPRGNLYGTTSYGGNPSCNASGNPSGCGVVFELSPPNGGGPWTNTVLYTFSGPDGQYPSASLLPDQQGNYYGTGGRRLWKRGGL